jgi:hypothetical protein
MNTRNPLRIGGALLLGAALYACDGTAPVAVQDETRTSTFTTQQCIEVTPDAVYSGPPNRENFTINLNDQWIYVEFNSIGQYLPRPGAVPDDVRLGDDWETGTPAESFQILDIDQDGDLDIRLRFSKSQLVSDGNLDGNTTEVQVWGLDRLNNNEHCGSERVEVTLPPPAPGQDVVVLNDINIFDNERMANPNNVRFVQNLVTFESDGPRNFGNVVMWDRGRLSRCGVPVGSPAGNGECLDANMNTARMTIIGQGMAMMDVMSVEGSLTNIPANVKSIWLWNPRVAFTVNEINALKQFASEGGRIVFIGEWDGFYTPIGIAVENQFLRDMGAIMRNTGGAVDCGNVVLPGSSLREHQVMEGLTNLGIACASVIDPGPQDFILFYSLNGQNVLGGVARIDTSPLVGTGTTAPYAQTRRTIDPRMNPNSSTGR